jgi:endoglucanase
MSHRIASRWGALISVLLLPLACSAGGADAPEVSEDPEANLGSVEQPVSLYASLVYRGVNLAGADFGEQSLPGTFGTHYTYPSPEFGYNGASYFIAKGMNTFRVPFRWERLQRSLGGALDATELDRLSKTVSGLTNRGAYVLLDPHNYARYNGALINSGSVSYAQFADFWTRLANVFKGNSRVIFGLMNEPHGMSTDVWVSAANQAIAAIRATGAGNLILVPGNAWTGAHSWNQSWYGTPNAQALLNIRDSGNNYAFEVHQYLDSDFSGTTDSCVSNTIGSQKLVDFTNWLKQNGKRGFLGEFGGGRNATCSAALDNIVDYMESNASVWLGWTYWAAGPMWGDYIFTLEPTGSTASPVDRPQMDALESHLTPDGGTCQPVTCGSAVCGSKPNGCGGTLSCGGCPAGQTCNASNHCVTTSTTQAPFGGSARSVTSTIQAEDYDVGGEGVAYHDTTAGNASGGTQRGSDGVDLEATADAGGGLNVGWSAPGEWLEYTVNVATTGSYSLELRVAAIDPGKRLHIELNGVNVSGSITAPDTNGWQTYQTLSVPNVNLTAGNNQVLRVVFDTDGVNLSWLRFSAGSMCTPTTCAALGATCGTPSNGCGGALSCGSCSSGQSCNASNQCSPVACTPTTCAALGATCGAPSNGCGGTLSCGACVAGQTCSSANRCEATSSGSEPCTPSKTLTTQTNSGSFGTTGPYCFRTSMSIAGWGCSNFNGRSLQVNDVAVSCGASLPAKFNGYYYFEATNGAFDYASIYWWQ